MPTVETVAARWDHPRVCGEKLFIVVTLSAAVGSPPRMRGKVSFHSLANVYPGITPAYAGKSTLRMAFALHSRDHPRVCGEKTVASVMLLIAGGSPPHMRGKASISL